MIYIMNKTQHISVWILTSATEVSSVSAAYFILSAYPITFPLQNGGRSIYEVPRRLSSPGCRWFSSSGSSLGARTWGATRESTGRVRTSASLGREDDYLLRGRDRTIVNAAQELPHPDQTAPAGATSARVSSLWSSGFVYISYNLDCGTHDFL